VGFLVSRAGHVLTAGHVASSAMRPTSTIPEIQQERLLLDFPFSGGGTFEAQLRYLRTPDAEKRASERRDDIAVLQLVTGTAPSDVAPQPIEVAPAAPGLEVRSFGYARGYDDGVWVSGKLQGQISNGLLQMETPEIDVGFAGAPVWDALTGNVVGMVVAIGQDTSRGFAMPAEALLDALSRVPDVPEGEVPTLDQSASAFPADFSASQERERLNIAARALADQWSEVDQLGYRVYALALADFIEDERTKKPLTIGIDAPWGMGKTTLMRLIKERVEEDRPQAPSLPTVWFNAWKHDKEESLWAALALEILRQTRERLRRGERVTLWLQLNKERFNVRFLLLRLVRALVFAITAVFVIVICAMITLQIVDDQAAADQVWRYIGLIGGLGVLATLYNTIGKDIYRRLTSPFKLNIADYIEEPNYEERVGFLAQFEADFERVIRTVTKYGKRSLPLVIFIDDLDRAASPKPVEIFEAINTLLDTKQCVFVLGMDSQAVAKSIEAKYKDLMEDSGDADGSEPSLGRRFLEKIVQIPFVLPRANPSVFLSFANVNLESGDYLETVTEDRDKVIQAERLIDQQQRGGKSLDEAVESVQARPDISEEAVRVAKEELRATRYAQSFADSKEVRQAVADALPYLGYNPRKVKRFINLFKLQALIANRRELLNDGTIELKYLAKWVIISTRWPGVAEAALSDPTFITLLIQTHDTYIEVQAIKDATKRRETRRSKLNPLLADSRVKQFYRAKELIKLLNELPLSETEMLAYLYLTRVTSDDPLASSITGDPQS
jgi:hypothetical protein